jgi:predicted alpha/beta superfamily hydrolase
MKTQNMKKAVYFLLILIMVLSCTHKRQNNDPIPPYDTFQLKSIDVNEIRVINIWTSSDYKSSTNSLLILYMADGGIKEDFPHIANTISKLIENKSIPPIILVGIENTDRRKDLSGPSEVEVDSEFFH